MQDDNVLYSFGYFMSKCGLAIFELPIWGLCVPGCFILETSQTSYSKISGHMVSLPYICAHTHVNKKTDRQSKRTFEHLMDISILKKVSMKATIPVHLKPTENVASSHK